MSTSPDDIEQLVQARWRAIGLSQTDLAEVLCAESVPDTSGLDDTTKIDARRLAVVADVLGLVTGIVNPPIVNPPATNPPASKAGQPRAAAPAAQSLQSLLELRMLRVFREVQDPATKRILIELAEQIVKRQTTPPDAG
ncbi:hypothetical protein JQ633_22555 [Bradyrhizobium tropiciagri]|uniref:hypothetical protein n=1 Tax=Bradyrhizobium tropiciagri TaxID=312253 RepID=UPI001BA9892B|nr:hypothetical protein [Bradyrhizobium tropiciagri]MBR0873155.1 hypothetical protein [Bradyrhizobium tropiciagri]